MKTILHSGAPIKDPDWTPVDAALVVSGEPMQAYEVLYTDPTGAFSTGIYQSTPGTWRIAYTEDEFCTLIEGTVRLTNDTGDIAEYTAPVSFVIPSGFKGTWESVGDIRKHFVIYEKEQTESQKA